MSIYIGILFSAIGFAISAYIYKKKLSTAPMVCPLNGKCDLVIYSRFAKVLGIRIELLGMIYYGSVWILYAIKAINPEVVTPAFNLLLIGLSSCGFIFSIYLTAIQGFVLKSWCTWCLSSAFCNAFLFSMLFTLPVAPMAELLAKFKTIALILHNVGFVFGVGAATITDLLFFRFLRDHKISEEEKGTLDTLTSVIWTGLFTLLVSGLALYLPEQEKLSDSPKFLLKAIVVGVVLVNGFFLSFKIGPYLRQLSFDKAEAPTHLRRLAFALGAISITSWYMAFFLDLMRKISVSFEIGLLMFLGLVLFAVFVSQVFERTSQKKFLRKLTK